MTRPQMIYDDRTLLILLQSSNTSAVTRAYRHNTIEGTIMAEEKREKFIMFIFDEEEVILNEVRKYNHVPFGDFSTSLQFKCNDERSHPIDT